MATVYRAYNKLIGTPCAIKILEPRVRPGPDSAGALPARGAARAALAHPNIIEIFDQGDTDDGPPFLVMELLQGTSLADVVERGLVPLARALPSGCRWRGPRPRPRLRGRSPRSQAGERVPADGRPGEAPRLRHRPLRAGRAAHQPRRDLRHTAVHGARAQHDDRRGPPADLYSLGVIMFEMITQRLPFDAPDPGELDPEAHERAAAAPQGAGPGDAGRARPPRQRPAGEGSLRAPRRRVPRARGARGDRGREPDRAPPPPEAMPRDSAVRSRGAGRDPWVSRLDLFERMTARAFGASAPADIQRQLDALRGVVREHADLRSRALDEQRRLEGVAEEWRTAGCRSDGRWMRSRSTPRSRATRPDPSAPGWRRSTRRRRRSSSRC